MKWQQSVHQEIIALKIKETELAIQSLEVKLQRLRIESEKGYTDNDQTTDQETDKNYQTPLGHKDRDGEEIHQGDKVVVLTPSKNSRFFNKGDEALVEGKTEQGRVLISATEDKTERTNRTGNNLRILDTKYRK